MRTTTTVLDMDLEVEFDYTPGRTGAMYPLDRAYPPEPATVEIEGIYLEGLEISGLLAGWVISVCEDAAYYCVQNMNEEEEDPRYEERREEERLEYYA